MTVPPPLTRSSTLDLKLRLRAPYVAPLNILQCMCLKALREFNENENGCKGESEHDCM